MLSLPIGLYPKKGNGVVISNYEDYQKLPANKKHLMPLIQTNNRPYICRGVIFFTCLKEFKGTDTIIHKSETFQNNYNTTAPSCTAKKKIQKFLFDIV